MWKLIERSQSFVNRTSKVLNRSFNQISNSPLTQSVIDAIQRQQQQILQKPSLNLHYSKEDRNIRRVSQLSHLNQFTYAPNLVGQSPLINTISGVMFNEEKQPVRMRRETLMLSDGGSLALDWAEPKVASKTPKLAVVLHGLTGGSETKLIQSIVQKGQNSGFHMCVVHNRCIGRAPMTAPYPFDSPQLHDMRYALQYVQNCLPNASSYAIATSWGGNQLLRYFWETKKANEQHIFKGGVIISAPFDVGICTRHLEGTVYEQFLVRRLKRMIVEPNLRELRKLKKIIPTFDADKLMNGKPTFPQFYKDLHLKAMNMKSPEEYYQATNITNEMIENVDTPMLVLHAKDDPMVPHHQVPLDQLAKNKHIIVAETNMGGHVSWMESVNKPNRWYLRLVYEYLDMICNEGDKACEGSKPQSIEPLP